MSFRTFVALLLAFGLFAACSGSGVRRDPLARDVGRGGASAGAESAGAGQSTGGSAPIGAGRSGAGRGSSAGRAPDGAGGAGGTAGAGHTNGGDGGMAGESGDAGESGEAGVPGSGGSGHAGGRSSSGGTPSVGGMPNAGRPSTGGMPSGGRPGTGGVTNAGGVGGAGNASGSGNSAGMGNPGPISKDSLVYWFSADAGVTETGGVISEWLDRSGNETSASQLTVESRPTLGKLGGSDLPAVVFDGLDDHLVLPPLAANFGEGLSYFSVVRAAANDGCKSMLEVSNGSEIEEISFFLHLQAFTYEVGNETIHGQEGAFIAGTPLLLDVTHSYTQGVSLFLNGLGTGTSAFPEPVTTTRNQNFLGRSLYVDCTPWSGEIAELLLYARTLPTEESQAVRLYLTEKWGCCDAT